jgi:flagellar protein FlaJ
MIYELYRQSGLAFSYRRYLFILTVAPIAAGATAGIAALFLLGPVAAVANGAVAA